MELKKGEELKIRCEKNEMLEIPVKDVLGLSDGYRFSASTNLVTAYHISYHSYLDIRPIQWMVVVPCMFS